MKMKTIILLVFILAELLLPYILVSPECDLDSDEYVPFVIFFTI